MTVETALVSAPLLLLLVLGAISIPAGVAKLRYAVSAARARREGELPFASIIAPCKGAESGLAENARALLRQDYGRYEVIYVVERADDPAVPVLRDVIAARGDVPARLLVAGISDGCSQKIHNILAGTRAAAAESQVFAYVDSDALPHADWLRCLAATLFEDPAVGAATGYRWQLGHQTRLSTVLCTAWDALVAVNFHAHRLNFAWGGSMAITRANFERLGVADLWATAISEDLTLTNAVNRDGKYVAFAPRCLTASYVDATVAEVLDFGTRQMQVARVYSPARWRNGTRWATVAAVTFFGSLAWVVASALRGQLLVLPAALLALVYLLLAVRGWLLYRWASALLPEHRSALDRFAWVWILLTPLAWLLHVYTGLRSALSRRMVWRGVTYELVSPTQTLVLGRRGDDVGQAAGAV